VIRSDLIRRKISVAVSEHSFVGVGGMSSIGERGYFVIVLYELVGVGRLNGTDWHPLPLDVS
jgi:hypothetical protein